MTVDFGRPPMYGPLAIEGYMWYPPAEYIQFHCAFVNGDGDVFHGSGFVDGPNVPAPACINDVIWYGATEQEESKFECNEFYNKPIC